MCIAICVGRKSSDPRPFLPPRRRGGALGARSWRLSNSLGSNRNARKARCRSGARPCAGAVACHPRLLHSIKRSISDLAVAADALVTQQTAVGGVAGVPQFLEFLEVAQPSTNGGVAVVVDDRLDDSTPWVITRERKRGSVRLLTPGSKINCTWSGRPSSRFSRITSCADGQPRAYYAPIVVDCHAATCRSATPGAWRP